VVLMPALNEEATIHSIIQTIKRDIPRSIPDLDELEIVVVDDGSTDNTAKISRDSGASVVSHPTNQGVGAAIQTGLAEALKRRAEVTVNIDADGQFDPHDIPKLVAPIMSGEADFVTASRFKDPNIEPVMPSAKRWGNYCMSWLISKIAEQKFHDVSCGFRAYSHETLLHLTLQGKFTYTQETFLTLAFKGLKIVEMPVSVRGAREFGKSRVANNLFHYGFQTLRIILGCVRDYRPVYFFGVIAGALAFIGLTLSAVFFGHFLWTGSFSPNLWIGFLGSFFILLAVFAQLFGQIAAMLDRIRFLQEEQLYLLREFRHNVSSSSISRGTTHSKNTE